MVFGALGYTDPSNAIIALLANTLSLNFNPARPPEGCGILKIHPAGIQRLKKQDCSPGSDRPCLILKK
jgi:hypothetical protein